MHERPDDILDSTAAGTVIIRGGAHRLLAYGVGMVLSLAGLIVVTRTLGPERFGVFQSIVSIVMIVGAVTDAGLGALGIREYTQNSGLVRDRMMATLLGVRLTLTVVGLAAVLLVLVVGGGSRELVIGSLVAGVGLALTVIQTTATIQLSVELRNGALSLLDLLRQALTTVGYVLGALAGAGVVTFAGVSAPVSLTVLFATVLVLGRPDALRISINFEAWRNLLRAAGPLAFATGAGVAHIYATQLVAAVLMTHFESGQFALAFRVFVVLGSVSGLVATVAFPLLARTAGADDQRFHYALGRMLDVSLLLGVGFSVLLATGADSVVTLMGADFAGAEPAIRLIGVALTFVFVSAPLGFALIGLRLERPLLLVNLLALLVGLASVALLSGSLEAAGAALGTVIGQAVLVTGYIGALARAGHRPMPSYRVAVQVLVVALVASAAVWMPGPALVAPLIGAAIYASGVLLSGALPPELRSLLR